MSTRPPGSSTRTALVAALGFIALVALGWLASDTPLRIDDYTFMLVSYLFREDALIVLEPQHWFGHFRPLFYLSWWTLGPLSVDGAAVRALEVVLWAGTITAVALTGWRARGAPGLAIALIALPLHPVFLELLLWKSWLTSVGTIAFMSLGALELTRQRPRWALILALGLLALGFKETGAMALGVLALLSGKGAVRWAGGALILGAIAAAVPATPKLAPDHSVLGALQQVINLAPMVWLVPVAVAMRWRRAPWWALVASAGVVVLPDPARGPLALVAVFALAWPHRAWLAAVFATWALSTLGADAPPHYLMEGWVLLAVLLATRVEVPPRPVLLVAAALGALWFAPRYIDVYRMRQPEAAAQRAFLATFHPEPAQGLFIPPGGYKVDLDVLVWLDLGAESLFEAPGNSLPVQVGPLSGIWADVVPADPAWPMYPTPPRGFEIRKPPKSQLSGRDHAGKPGAPHRPPPPPR